MGSALSQLSPDLVAMMARGVSVQVASRDARLRPSVMRAMASAVDAQAGTVTAWLSRRQAGQLLADVAATGRVAMLFSEPSTHRTVQLKASGAQLRDASEADRAQLARYLASMEHEIGLLGYAAPLVRAMFAARIEDLVALTIAPEEVFEQTPGPKAGALLAGAKA
jgi:hypothetical protein